MPHRLLRRPLCCQRQRFMGSMGPPPPPKRKAQSKKAEEPKPKACRPNPYAAAQVLSASKGVQHPRQSPSICKRRKPCGCNVHKRAGRSSGSGRAIGGENWGLLLRTRESSAQFNWPSRIAVTCRFADGKRHNVFISCYFPALPTNYRSLACFVFLLLRWLNLFLSVLGLLRQRMR